MSTINYMEVHEMTEDEKLKMYMKCSKKEIAKMLIESNRHLDLMIKNQQQFFIPSYPALPEYPTYPNLPMEPYYTTGESVKYSHD